MQDVLLDEQFEGHIEVIAVDTLDEVMEHALITHEQKQSLVERLGSVIDRLTPDYRVQQPPFDAKLKHDFKGRRSSSELWMRRPVLHRAWMQVKGPLLFSSLLP